MKSKDGTACLEDTYSLWPLNIQAVIIINQLYVSLLGTGLKRQSFAIVFYTLLIIAWKFFIYIVFISGYYRSGCIIWEISKRIKCSTPRKSHDEYLSKWYEYERIDETFIIKRNK